MFPILALAGLAFTSSAVAGTAATVAVGATLAGSTRKKKKLEQQQREDMNPKVEREFYKARALQQMKVLPPSLRRKAEKDLIEDLKNIDQGSLELSLMPWSKSMMPKGLKDLAGDYVLTPREEVLFYFALLQAQVQEGSGPAGELLKKLSRKGGVPYNKVAATLFEDREMNASLRPLLLTLRKVSKERLASQELRERLSLAMREKQKHPRSR